MAFETNLDVPWLGMGNGPKPEQPPASVGPNSALWPRAVRVAPFRPSSIPPAPVEQVVTAITDLLMAAAHSDGELCRREQHTVRRVTQQLLECDELPGWVRRRIDDFDVATFDMQRTVASLRGLPTPQKRYVLEVVRRVCDANNAFDLEEERFLSALVLALECTDDDHSDLLLRPSPGLDGFAKRAFDVAFAGTFLLLAWPALLVIALAIRISSNGPVLFAQRRYGRGGAEIRVYKFRSMRTAEDGAVVRQATVGDERITRLGSFLRRTSLDELPQFVNVLRGEMSVVGPRPHAVAHNQFYRTQILEYMLRHKVKPGITGLAQVNGWRGETDTLDKMVQRVAYDLEYIRRQSLWLDVLIVLRTVFGRTTRKNAY